MRFLRLLGRIARFIARVALILVAVALGALLILLVALKTESGRAAIVRRSVALFNTLVPGRLELAGFEGDLTHRIVLHRLRWTDPEGQEAAFVERLALRFDLLPLWHQRLQIDDVDVSGMRVAVRHLSDNRVNFAPKAHDPERVKAQKKVVATHSNFAVHVGHVHVQFEGDYSPPHGYEKNPLTHPHGTFDLEGSLDTHGAAVSARVTRLVSDARDPLRAHVELSGAIDVEPGAAPHGAPELRFADVALRVTTDGTELRRLNPAVRTLPGRWSIRVDGGGPLADLKAQVGIATPHGAIAVDGALQRLVSGFHYQGRATLADFDPTRLWEGLRQELKTGAEGGRVDLTATVSGVNADGSVALQKLDARLGAASAHASGQANFAGFGQLDLTAGSRDLAELERYGVRGLTGNIQLQTHLERRPQKLVLATAVKGSGLRSGKTNIGLLDANIRAAAESIAPGTWEVRLAQLRATTSSGSFGLAHATSFRLSGLQTQRDGSLSPRLVGALSGVHVDLHGVRTANRIGADLDLRSSDLSLIDPRFGGRFELHARGALARRHGGPPSVELDGDFAALHLGPVQVARASLRGQLGDGQGTATVAVDGAHYQNLVLDHIDASVAGDLQKIGVTVHGRGPEATSLALSADVKPTPTQHRVEVDLQSLIAGKGDDRWPLNAPAAIVVDYGKQVVDVSPLTIGVPNHLLTVSGHYGPTGPVSGALDIHGVDLLALGPWAGRENLPEATLDTHVRLDGTAQSPRLIGAIAVRSSRTVSWYGLAFNALSATFYGDRQALRLTVAAQGSDTTHVDLELNGKPLFDRPLGNGEKGLSGLAANLDTLALKVHEHQWGLRRPCALRLDLVGGIKQLKGPRAAGEASVEHCALASGKEAVAIEAHLPFDKQAPLEALLSTEQLDLREVGELLAPGHKEQPKTSFDLRAHASGTMAAPILDLQLAGVGSQVDEGVPETVDYRLEAHWANQRAKGAISFKQVGIKLGIGARFDVPTSFKNLDQPFNLELEARPVPFFKLRDALPPQLAGLRGFFTLGLRAQGTLRHPTFDAELHTPWTLDDLADNQTTLNAHYDGSWLTVNSKTVLGAESLVASILKLKPRSDAGTVFVEMHAPVDLVALFQKGRAWSAFAHDQKVRATVAFKSVDFDKLPIQVVGLRAPFTRGHIDGELEIDGTLADPHIGGRWVAKGLAKPGRIDDMAIQGEVDYQHRLARVAADAQLGTHPVLSLRGQGAIDLPQVAAGGDWRSGAVQLDLDGPPTDLSTLPGVPLFLTPTEGHAAAHLRVRGTFGAPVLDAHLQLDDSRFGPIRSRHFESTLKYQSGQWAFAATSEQRDGGRLVLGAHVPSDPTAPLQARVDASHWDITGLELLNPHIGSMAGKLDGSWQVIGSRAQPHSDDGGTLTLTEAAFSLLGDPRLYRAAQLQATLSRSSVTVPRFTLLTDGGALEAQASAALDGWRVRLLTLMADAHHFVFTLGSLRATLNAKFALTAERTTHEWSSHIDLDDGQIDLPELVDGRQIQSLGALTDVHFNDSRARQSQQKRAARRGQLEVQLSGPLKLRSNELGVDLSGALSIGLGGDSFDLTGTATGSGGRFLLFGRRYVIEQLTAQFDGPPENPLLHARISRQVADAKLVLTIDGPAQDPHVTLSSEPPIYDPAQLVSLVLEAGPSGGARVSLRDFDQRVVGIFSNTLLRRLRTQLARALPVDVIRPDQSSYSELYEAPGEVGRFVSDRVYVQYEHHFGSQIGRSAENADEAQVRYRFSKSYELDTTFGDQGVAGIFLYWARKY